MKRYLPRSPLLAMMAFMLAITYPAYAADKEQLVKAAFLFNFTKFASWPAPVDIAGEGEFRICLLGPNTLDDATSVLEGGSSSTLAIKTKRISSAPTAPGQCHIVYITNPGNLDMTIRESHKNLALTVSDIGGFTEKGGIIGFVKESNKIRLYINKNAADAAGIKLDAQLLEIARKVIR